MIATIIDLNFSEFIDEGIIRLAFGPYLNLFGNLFWGLMFGFIGGALYANERSIGTITAYLLLVGAFTGFIFPASVVAILGIILAFALTTILYITFVTMRE